MDEAFSSFREMCRTKLMIVEEIITEVSAETLPRTTGYAMIDGGAHHGYHALRFAERAACERVVAVEADPFTVKTLRERVARAADPIAGKVTVLEAALQDDTERAEVTWMSSPSHPGRSGISSIWRDDPAVAFRDSVTVKATTIDTIRSSLEQPVRFIKLDLEGGDFVALRGGCETMRSDRCTIVFENSNRAPKIHGYAIADVVAYFHSIGYRLVSFSGEIVDERNFFDFWELWASPTSNAERLGTLIKAAWKRRMAEVA